MDCQCLKKTKILGLFLILVSGGVDGSPAGTDHTFMINFQGKIEHAGNPYQGTGYFKFAIIDDSIMPNHNIWTNDGSKPSPGHEPDNALPITVKAGEFFISLGDTQHGNMGSIVSFDKSEDFLRVWFSSDGHKFVQLSPDHPLSNQSRTFDARSANTLTGVSMTSMAKIVDKPSMAKIIDKPKKTTKVINAAFAVSN